MDSLRTMNLSGQTNRLLVGKYSDPDFGIVRAESYAQFASSNINTQIPENAIFDSLIFQFQYDFYAYGSSGKTTQTISIHEISKEINNDSTYYSTSSLPYEPSFLGIQDLIIDLDFFNSEYEDSNTDSVMTVKIRLDQSYGQRLFDSIDPDDENYTNFNLFKSIFKGLAIIPQTSNKIVGMNISSINSALMLYYHAGDTKSILPFSLSRGVNFSKISSDRSSTELAAISQFHSDFEPASNRYVQSGTSLVTKLDFSKYYEYIDTLSNIIINSAEISIENINPDGGFKKPSTLALGVLTDNNRFKVLKTKQDTTDFFNFSGTLTIGTAVNADLPLSLFATNDQGSLLTLVYSAKDNSFEEAFPTILFQKLFEQKDRPYPFWALVPASPPMTKSVTRTVFPKDNIKLKIYYTKPVTDSTE